MEYIEFWIERCRQIDKTTDNLAHSFKDLLEKYEEINHQLKILNEKLVK